MEEFFREKVMDSFSSMKTTDSISLEDIDKLRKLESYYIDPFNYISNIMQDEDNFIVGRRGTGKSTLLYRAFIECINSWEEEKRIYKKRVLPIFIDLSKCDAISKKFDDEIKFEEYFTYELVRNFRNYIYLVWDKIVPYGSESEESLRLDDINRFMSELDEFIKRGSPISVNYLEERSLFGEGNTKNISAEILHNSFHLGGSKQTNSSKELETTIITKYNYTLGEFLDKLTLIKDFANITSIYVFIDEYSELSISNQKILAGLLKRLRGTRKGIYFKICAITDNYDLGEIRLQRDFYEISLDLYKFIERSNGLNDAFDRLKKFTENIVQERLNAYDCNIKIDNLFSDYNQSIELLTRASIGIPRTVGIILKEAWTQVGAKERFKITNDDLIFGIKSAGDSYYGFFSGNVGPVIPQFYEDMLEEILTRARKERKVNTGKAANMFLVKSFRDSHFKYLTENYLIHLLKKGETSVKGETSLSLYMIDVSFIYSYNLGFTLDRDIYRQQRFVYDDVMINYDVYFTKTRKEYKCPCCDKEYTQEQLLLPQLDTYIDFCPKDKTKLIKIEGAEMPEYVLTETERKIVGTIRNRTRNDAILARDVAEIVGCNKIKVAKFAEKVTKDNLINREKVDGSSNPYRYYRGNEG